MPTSPEAPSPNPLSGPEPWDLVADAYVAETQPLFTAFAADALRLAALPPSPRIVDVAAGPGTLALLAAAQGARVSALDFSPAMIANLEKQARAAGLSGLDIRQGDGQSLPYADESFEGAFCMFGLIFYPDRLAGLRELRRVLRPGHRAVISSWAPMEGAIALMMQALRDNVPGLPPKADLPLGNPDDVRREMEAAGFRNVEVVESRHPQLSPSTRAFWERAQRTSAPLLLQRRRLGEEKWAPVAAAVWERLRGELGEGPQALAGKAWLGAGIR